MEGRLVNNNNISNNLVVSNSSKIVENIPVILEEELISRKEIAEACKQQSQYIYTY